MVWTNLGKQKMFEEFFCSGAIASEFRLHICASAGEWSADTSSTSDLTIVSSLEHPTLSMGGGSGIIVNRDGVGDGSNFDVSSWLDLGLSAARAVLQTTSNDYQFSGAFSGGPAEYVILTEGDPATYNPLNADVYAWWSIGSPINVAQGNTLTITGLSLQGN